MASETKPASIAGESAADSATSVESAYECYKTEVLEKHGGPSQYLRTILNSPEMIEDFASWLWEAFPLKADQEYCAMVSDLRPISADSLGSQMPQKVHVAMLGFTAACSMKPDPSSHAAGKLAQNLLIMGFKSGGEPLQVKALEESECPRSNSCPWSTLSTGNGPVLLPFSLAFSKGMLRVSALLSLLCFHYSLLG